VILHGYYRSSAAYRVRIALNLKGIACEMRSHHLLRGEQRAEAYRTLNPQGLVPTLETGDGLISQSLAIVEYLDEIQPAPPLLPAGAADRAYCRSLAQIIACDIHPIDNLRVLNYLRDELDQDRDAVRRWFNHWISAGFDALEAILARDSRTGTFAIGEMPGLADLVLVPQVFNAARYQLDMTRYPTISRINAACQDIAAFANAHPSRQPDAEQAS